MRPLALPAELSPDKTERLRVPGPDAVSEPVAVQAAAPPAEPEPAPVAAAAARPRGALYRLSRRMARTFLGPRISAKVRRLLLQPGEDATEALRRSESSSRRIEALEQQVGSMQRRSLDVELVGVEVHAATVNLELLKGEVNAVERALEDLGMAIAPATGLAGAGVRLSELRERVNGLDRRLRAAISATLAQPSGPPRAPGATLPDSPAAAGNQAPAAAAGGSAPESALFDYVAFERRFRGDPEAIAAELSSRYLEVLAASTPVIDVGCGRGELVELLAKRGVEAIGVDTDPSMVAEARDRGLDVRLVDGGSFLRGLEPGSVGAIIATHVVEHIDLADLVELLELAATRLRPGGVFIAETPNPASLIVLGNSYILDPTHVRPLHPSLLAFLCEGAGFRDVRLQFYAPASGYHLPLIEDPEAPPWAKQVNQAFTRLNSVLFGPQEYAIIARAAPAADEDDEGDEGDAEGDHADQGGSPGPSGSAGE